jgi:hypothetical protein
MNEIALNVEEIHEFVTWVESSGASDIEFYIDDFNMPMAKFNGSELSYQDWYELENCSLTMH